MALGVALLGAVVLRVEGLELGHAAPARVALGLRGARAARGGVPRLAWAQKQRGK